MLFFIKFLIQKLTNNYFSKILSFLYMLNLRQGVLLGLMWLVVKFCRMNLGVA